jgi:hypothetical protein
VKRVYFFGNGKAEGGADMKDLLGGKGAEPRGHDQGAAARPARLHDHRPNLRRVQRR